MYYDGSYIIRMNGCQVFNSEEEAFNKFHGYIPAIIVDDDDEDNDDEDDDDEDDVDNKDDNCDNSHDKWCSDVIDCDDDVDVWLWRLWYLSILMYEW